MKIKTSELTGLALDWAVATCGNLWKGESLKIQFHIIRWSTQHHYSTDWAQGGPIIEREGIDLYCNVPSGVAAKNKGWLSSWRAAYRRCGVGSEMFYAPDPLIAAMRCYVASKLGEELDIPEELI